MNNTNSYKYQERPYNIQSYKNILPLENRYIGENPLQYRRASEQTMGLNNTHNTSSQNRLIPIQVQEPSNRNMLSPVHTRVIRRQISSSPQHPHLNFFNNEANPTIADRSSRDTATHLRPLSNTRDRIEPSASPRPQPVPRLNHTVGLYQNLAQKAEFKQTEQTAGQIRQLPSNYQPPKTVTVIIDANSQKYPKGRAYIAETKNPFDTNVITNNHTETLSQKVQKQLENNTSKILSDKNTAAMVFESFADKSAVFSRDNDNNNDKFKDNQYNSQTDASLEKLRTQKNSHTQDRHIPQINVMNIQHKKSNLQPIRITSSALNPLKKEQYSRRINPIFSNMDRSRSVSVEHKNGSGRNDKASQEKQQINFIPSQAGSSRSRQQMINGQTPSRRNDSIDEHQIKPNITPRNNSCDQNDGIDKAHNYAKKSIESEKFKRLYEKNQQKLSMIEESQGQNLNYSNSSVKKSQNEQTMVKNNQLEQGENNEDKTLFQLKTEIGRLNNHNSDLVKAVEEKDDQLYDLAIRFKILQDQYTKMEDKKNTEINQLKQRLLSINDHQSQPVFNNIPRSSSRMDKSKSRSRSRSRSKLKSAMERDQNIHDQEIREIVTTSFSDIWNNLHNGNQEEQSKTIHRNAQGYAHGTKTNIRYQLEGDSPINTEQDINSNEAGQSKDTKKRNSTSIGGAKNKNNNAFDVNRDSHRGFSLKAFMPISENAEYDNSNFQESQNEGIEGSNSTPTQKNRFYMPNATNNRSSYPAGKVQDELEQMNKNSRMTMPVSAYFEHLNAEAVESVLEDENDLGYELETSMTDNNEEQVYKGRFSTAEPNMVQSGPTFRNSASLNRQDKNELKRLKEQVEYLRIQNQAYSNEKKQWKKEIYDQMMGMMLQMFNSGNDGMGSGRNKNGHDGERFFKGVEESKQININHTAEINSYKDPKSTLNPQVYDLGFGTSSMNECNSTQIIGEHKDNNSFKNDVNSDEEYKLERKMSREEQLDSMAKYFNSLSKDEFEGKEYKAFDSKVFLEKMEPTVNSNNKM